jgi:hypothetical protein
MVKRASQRYDLHGNRWSRTEVARKVVHRLTAAVR